MSYEQRVIIQFFHKGKVHPTQIHRRLSQPDFWYESGKRSGLITSTMWDWFQRQSRRRLEDTERKQGLDGIVVLAILMRLFIGAQNMKMKMSEDGGRLVSE
jgi:hypothetical protein